MTRVISISDKAYDRLKALKKTKSFSEAIIDLTEKEKTRDLFDIVIARETNAELADAIEEVYLNRNRFKFRKVES